MSDGHVGAACVVRGQQRRHGKGTGEAFVTRGKGFECGAVALEHEAQHSSRTRVGKGNTQVGDLEALHSGRRSRRAVELGQRGHLAVDGRRDLGAAALGSFNGQSTKESEEE